MAALARGWKEKLQQEWRGIDEKGLLRFLGGQASVGYRYDTVTPEPAATPPAAWSLTPPEDSTPFLAVEAAGALSDYLALLVAPVGTAWQVRWAGELVAGIGPVSLSAGRAPGQAGFAAPGGGVVLGGEPLRDRVEFQIYRPVDICIGLLTLDVSLARLGAPTHAANTLLWEWSLQYQPVPRLTFGLQSGIMMGGETWEQLTGQPFTISDFFSAITYRGGGYQNNGYTNNVFSVTGRWRLPTEDWVPITLYGEWGGDDNGGAWLQAPGIDAGILIPSLPFAPEVSVGLEASFFGEVCNEQTGGTFCRSPGYSLNWYTHAYSWTTGDLPLGHRMGGNGRELFLYASADLLDARLLIRGDAFLRNRFSGNLYSPYTRTERRLRPAGHLALRHRRGRRLGTPGGRQRLDGGRRRGAGDGVLLAAGAGAWTRGVVVHQRVAVHEARREVVVDPAEQPAVVHGGRASEAPRDDVVELNPSRRAADAAAVERPGAPAVVPPPDCAAHRGGNVVRSRRARIGLRFRHLAPPPRLLLEEQVERGLEDLTGRGFRLRVGLAGPGAVQLGDELLRDGDVDPAELEGERLGHERLLRGGRSGHP